MAVSTLSQANSLNPGADLWVIPDLAHSKSAQRLDWYMNFQITRASQHKTQALAPELSNLLQNCRLPETHYGNEVKTNLMFDSSKLLPNRWLIMVDDQHDSEKWIQQIANVWSNLSKPSLRIFLPAGLSSGDFQKIWKKCESFDDFAVVVD